MVIENSTEAEVYRVAVMISGRGSNFRALVHEIRQNKWPIEISVLVCDNENAAGLQFAREQAIPVEVVAKAGRSKQDFDRALIQAVRPYEPHLIVLAGFMRVLGSEFINYFKDKIINIHPSLLPAFRGLNVHQAALDAGVKFSGATVHFVIDDVDAGPIIAQSVVPVLPEDSAESLAARILITEHKLLPAVVRAISQRKVEIIERNGHRVTTSSTADGSNSLLSLEKF